mmetsp:Transcript_107961/g.207590  ORF Transcript_107961/g.207590 Transcript_107961/m.207590 type:complete len:275 (+) Transcript_107961:172-996(+)
MGGGALVELSINIEDCIKVQRHLGGRRCLASALLQGLLPHISEKRVRQCLSHCDPRRGSKAEHPLQQVQGLRVCVRKPFLKSLALACTKECKVTSGVLALQLLNRVFGRRADEIEDNIHLVKWTLRVVEVVALSPFGRLTRVGRVTWEQVTSLIHIDPRGVQYLQKLCEYASHGPHIDGLRVVGVKQNELGCAVEARHNVVRQNPLRFQRGWHNARPPFLVSAWRGCRGAVYGIGAGRLRGGNSASQAKITDLDSAVPHHHAIRWLQIAMVHTS